MSSQENYDRYWDIGLRIYDLQGEFDDLVTPLERREEISAEIKALESERAQISRTPAKRA